MRLPAPAPIRLRAAVAIPAVLCLLQVVIGVLLAATLPEIRPMDLRGVVRCTSGAAVQGVWIEGFSGGSQFAQIVAKPDAATLYSYRLPYGGNYQVRVGCGGTPADWKLEARSAYVDAAEQSFTCHDRLAEPTFGTCTR